MEVATVQGMVAVMVLAMEAVMELACPCQVAVEPYQTAGKRVG